jgi:hypothetical protein
MNLHFANSFSHTDENCHIKPVQHGETIFRGLLYRLIKIKIYVSIILSVALYGFKTWSLTLREEHRRRVFVNRVLRRVFGPKWDGVTGKDYITRIFTMCTHQMLFG